SLLAVRLMNRIQQVFEQDLALALIFQKPTIEQLAEVLRKRTIPPQYSSLVSIQPGGSKSPFFCVHPAGGNVFCYMPLARSLGPNQPFYGLQSVGLYGDHEPYETIEEMATHYIEALRIVQPQGPYQLGGWSQGGVIAFEMAQQLHRQGQQVSLLALIDSDVPDNTAEPPDFDQEALALTQLILREASELVDIAQEKLQELQPEEALHYVLEQVRKVNQAKIPTTLSELALPQTTRLIQVNKANYLALTKYVPRAYPGHLVLFRASEIEETASSSYQNAPQLWKALATGGFDIQTVPGTHLSIVTEPHVQYLADQLN